MKKDTTSLIMPDGPPTDAAPNDTQEETTIDEQTAKKTGVEGSPEEEAKELYDEIMEDDPKVCKALYELLKDKYEGDENTTKAEKARERTSGNEDYSDEDMPKD